LRGERGCEERKVERRKKLRGEESVRREKLRGEKR
jgi:hypothetical protein